MNTTADTPAAPSTPRADRGLTAPGPARLAVWIRTGLVVLVLMRLVLRDWWLLATTPAPLFEPVFAVSWMSGPPTRTLVTVFWGVGIVAAVACLLRLAPRVAFIAAWAAYVQLCAMWSSSGKVMHNDVLLVWACVPFLFAPAPRRDELDTVDERWGWAPRASLVVVAAVYCLSGLQKLRHSGIAWVDADNIAWVVRQGDGPLGAALNRDIAAQTWLMATVATVTILFEVGAPALLGFRRTRGLFVLVASGFHLGIFATLGLDYYGWIGTLVVVILPQAPLPAGLCRMLTRRIDPGRLPPAWRPDHSGGPGPPGAPPSQRPVSHAVDGDASPR